MKSITIIDYGMSNLLSISRAFEHINARVTIADTHEKIRQADYLVLPGVGAFPDGMKELEIREMIEPVKEHAASGKPLLGICLGMQMLLTTGNEHHLTKGLGIVPGEVVPLPKDTIGYKVPNINWHKVFEPEPDRWRSTIFKETTNNTDFYFVHSYFAQPSSNKDVLALSQFGDLKFAAAVQKENVTGTQFHPEKSGEKGLNLLLNFLNL